MELQDYIVNILKRREKDIDNIMYYWLTQSRNSEMFYLNEKGRRIINSDMAKEHLDLVTLYRIILSNEYPHKESELLAKPEPRSINPRYNAKIIREYEEKVKKEVQRKEYYNDFIETANKIIGNLHLGLTISQLKFDFNDNRTILKSLFKKIFSRYGIDLDDKVLDNIFGKVKLSDKKEFVDTIRLFTVGTAFNFPLCYQFSITSFGEANGIFSAFFMRAAGYLERFGNGYVHQRAESLTESDNNPFFKEKKVIKILASAMACCYGDL